MSGIWDWISDRGKALGAVMIGVLVVLASATSGDGRISGEEWFQIVMAGGTAVSVYLVPTLPAWSWLKPGMAAVLVAMEAAASYAIDGWSVNDTINVALAALGVLVVGVLPAQNWGQPVRRP